VPEIFRYQHRVTYAECTVGNHIYYARYLDLLEAARGEFLRKLGKTALELQQADMIFPVVEVHLKYKAPARYDDLLTIEAWLTELGKVRANFAYRILNQDGKLLLEGETWHVCTSLSEKPKRAPEDLVTALQPYLSKPVQVSAVA
jgi:acyl-CoA thioester hydrolase